MTILHEGNGSYPLAPTQRDESVAERLTEMDLQLRSPGSTPDLLDAGRPLAWWRSTRRTLVLFDTLAVLAGLAAGLLARPDLNAAAAAPRRYLEIAAGIALAWLSAVCLSGGYQARHLGTGSEEYKRVLGATLRTFGAVALTSYIFRLELPRGLMAIALPVGATLLLVGRFLARRRIVRARVAGRCVHRVLLVGDRRRVQELAQSLAAEPAAGFVPVGACVTDLSDDTPVAPNVPVVGGPAFTAEAAQLMGSDVVVVAGGPALGAEMLRDIAWSLEGSGVDLVVSPSLTNVAGPRVNVRPVAGLPLLYVDEPRFSGGKRVVKTSLDRVGALVGLVFLAPLLLTVGLAVRLTSRGPALFRQTRIGLDGKEFRVFKFRTMYQDAEARLADLQHQNESGGLLFKIKDDPRITTVGRFLRRTSIDELPQLLNVLLGHLSLVGPRPLPVKDSDFEGHVRRRLLVPPGITGLWQVSGRSDISWEDAVRLDLYYVENWSIGLDFLILLRTVTAITRGGGAY